MMRQQAPLKRRYTSARLRGTVTQKTAIFFLSFVFKLQLSNLRQDIDYPDRGFRGFPLSFHANFPTFSTFTSDDSRY
jgi:hypothetical protein